MLIFNLNINIVNINLTLISKVNQDLLIGFEQSL